MSRGYRGVRRELLLCIFFPISSSHASLLLLPDSLLLLPASTAPPVFPLEAVLNLSLLFLLFFVFDPLCCIRLMNYRGARESCDRCEHEDCMRFRRGDKSENDEVVVFLRVLLHLSSTKVLACRLFSFSKPFLLSSNLLCFLSSTPLNLRSVASLLLLVSSSASSFQLASLLLPKELIS